MARDLAIIAREVGSEKRRKLNISQVLAIYYKRYQQTTTTTATVVGEQNTPGFKFESSCEVYSKQEQQHRQQGQQQQVQRKPLQQVLHPQQLQQQQTPSDVSSGVENNQILPQGVSFNPKNTSWCARWTHKGQRHQASYNIKLFGNQGAKQLAILCRREAEKTLKFPKISEVISLYEAMLSTAAEEGGKKETTAKTGETTAVGTEAVKTDVLAAGILIAETVTTEPVIPEDETAARTVRTLATFEATAGEPKTSTVTGTEQGTETAIEVMKIESVDLQTTIETIEKPILPAAAATSSETAQETDLIATKTETELVPSVTTFDSKIN